ncbi:MAG: DUF2336 domain-containing protein [Pseudomonadota bacterium]
MNRLGPAKIGYEKAKALARDEDPRVRRELAARADVRPEVLYYLAEDADVEVRAAIAANATTPVKADLLLARDTDDDVRQRLARKIGRLVPNLPEDTRDRARDLTLEVLEVLMQDRLPHVRRMLAEELKATAKAPADVIRRLAQDPAIEVAMPVLEFSPLLTEADLLAILAAGPVEEAIAAIARRNGVSEPVSDAIVDMESVPAIAALLANPVAQIREETLDRIVAKAPGVRSWHEPLARRPHLPPRILRKLTDFLAVSLLQTMQKRGDLEPETAKLVAAALHARVRKEEVEEGDAGDAESETRESIAQEVRKLHAKGALDEKAVALALGAGQHAFVTEALAVLGRIPAKIAERVLNAGNAFAVAALSWKAGLGARLASRIQTRLAHIPPTEALSVESDAYPMSEDAMRLQLDSFQPAPDRTPAEEQPTSAHEPPPDQTPEDAKRRTGPIDPDWSMDGAARPVRRAVEPDWAARRPARSQVAEPDWARETPADGAAGDRGDTQEEQEEIGATGEAETAASLEEALKEGMDPAAPRPKKPASIL